MKTLDDSRGKVIARRGDKLSSAGLIIAFSFLAWITSFSVLAADSAPTFEKAIKPLLAAKCVSCHNAKNPASGLSLETPEQILHGGNLDGPAVIPGKSHESPLMQRVRGEKQPAMPLGLPPLSADQIALLAKWVDGIEKPAGIRSALAQHPWPFTRLERPQVPKVKNNGWVANPIDAFILAKLEAKGMEPAPPVSKRVLLRRIYFDLIGEPPTPEAVERFENDPRADAYEREIDKLLADPRYGERWGRHWLDLVRYADSCGGGLDYALPHAWRYRDYVIRSFNQDSPYDRFIREQLAGDAYPAFGAEGKIGLGYLALGVSVEGTGEELRRDLLIDLVNTTGSVFLGVTLGCARCHNHKYDPLPTRDYYRMEAFFAPVKIEPVPVPFTQYEYPGRWAARQKSWEALLAARHAAQEKLKAEYKERVEKARLLMSPQDIKDLAVPVSDADLKAAVDQGLLFTHAEQEAFRASEREHKAFANPNSPDLYKPMAYSADETLGSTNPIAPTTYVLKGGNMTLRGEAVEPGFLSAVTGSTDPVDMTGLVGTRRKLLAEWIASPDNPLTARVIVNRIWQHHFGLGLVATPSDFGKNGSGTVYPELIDWLATQFIDNGWSIKAVHRLILESNAYRQGMHNPHSVAYQKIDPERRYLWQMNPLRLESEALWDSILAVSGELNPSMGGPAFFPQVDDELLKEASTWWEPSPREERHRRSVYMLQQRSFIFPLISVFDGANTNESCPRRNVTTVTPQVFSLMNSRFVQEEAKAFAERIIRDTGADPEKQVDRAFHLALQRGPSAMERSRSVAFLKKAPLQELCVVLFNMNEFVFLE